MKLLVLSLPIITVLVAISGLIARALYSSETIASEYRVAARQAMAADDWPAAKFYYSRLVGAGDTGTAKDQFNWVQLLSASGELQAAKQQLSELAPEDAGGYGPAHVAMAQTLMSELSQLDSDRTEHLDRVKHHLTRGAWNNSTENDLLWAQYHLAMEQLDDAMARFSMAATRKPSLWFDLIGLTKQLDRQTDSDRAMQNAESHARKSIRTDPNDVGERLRLAAIMTEKEETEAVRRLLIDGLRRQPNEPKLKRAASDFALLQAQDLDADQSEATSRRLQLLHEAATLDPNNSRVYLSLQGFYSQSRSQEQKVAYREALETMITSGQDVAAAHFALGNLKFLEGDTSGAVFHFETAIEINPLAVAIANNLAWVLCHGEEPDLDRASQLAEIAFDKAPKNSSVMDTLAEIRIKQERFREALPLLEKILSLAQGDKRRELHEKLANIYGNLGQPEIAKRHQSAAAAVESLDLDR